MRRIVVATALAGAIASAVVGGTMSPTNASPALTPPTTVASTSTSASSPSVSAAVATTATSSPKTYSYGTHGYRNTLDVYTPSRAQGRTGRELPTVVIVHGGSWIKGNRTTMAPESRQFAGLGYVAISVDYRPATDAAWPAQRTDLRRALRWVRSHASDLNVDVDRIIVLGSSAGAEIAASALTYGHGSDLARGLITLSPPLDKRIVVASADETRAAARLANVVTDDLLGCTPRRCPDKYTASSPKTHLDRTDVPSLMFASRHEWVDPQGTYDFHAKARKVGLRSRLVVLEGSVHARDYWDRAWPTIRDWVAART
jgi:acetyl esterase/lipase